MTDWPRIVRDYSPIVWRISYRLLGNHADAADCLQETFVAAMAIARRQRVRNWPGLVRRVATTQAIAQLRRRLRQANRRSELTHWSTVPSGNPGPGQPAEDLELAAQLRRVLADLPAQQAEAVCLHYVEGMTYREVGRALGVKSGTVGSLLHRARYRVRELLTKTVVEHRR